MLKDILEAVAVDAGILIMDRAAAAALASSSSSSRLNMGHRARWQYRFQHITELYKGRLSYVVPRPARDVTLFAPGVPDEVDRPHPIPSACQAGAQVIVNDHPDVQCTAHVRLWDLEGRVAVRHDEVVKSPRKVPVEPVFGLLADDRMCPRCFRLNTPSCARASGWISANSLVP